MKRIFTLSLLLIESLVITGCVIGPKDRYEYITYKGTFSSFLKRSDQVVNVPLDTAVANLKRQRDKCVPAGHTEMPIPNISMSHYNRVTNNFKIEKVNNDKAEVSIQTQQSDTLFQPKGGSYYGAADLFRKSPTTTEIKIVSVYKHWLEVIPLWATGETKCLKIGGKE